MWPFSKKTEQKTEQITAVEELIRKVETLAEEDPDGWTISKRTWRDYPNEEYWVWSYRDSGIEVNGSCGSIRFLSDGIPIIPKSFSSKEKARIKTIDQNIAGCHMLRRLLRDGDKNVAI